MRKYLITLLSLTACLFCVGAYAVQFTNVNDGVQHEVSINNSLHASEVLKEGELPQYFNCIANVTGDVPFPVIFNYDIIINGVRYNLTQKRIFERNAPATLHIPVEKIITQHNLQNRVTMIEMDIEATQGYGSITCGVGYECADKIITPPSNK